MRGAATSKAVVSRCLLTGAMLWDPTRNFPYRKAANSRTRTPTSAPKAAAAFPIRPARPGVRRADVAAAAWRRCAGEEAACDPPGFQRRLVDAAGMAGSCGRQPPFPSQICHQTVAYRKQEGQL